MTYRCARGSFASSLGASSRRIPIEPGGAPVCASAGRNWASTRMAPATRDRRTKVIVCAISSRIGSARDEPVSGRRRPYATECVTVPVYVPATAAAGTLTISVGFQVAELFPTIVAAPYAVRETLNACAFNAAA